MRVFIGFKIEDKIKEQLNKIQLDLKKRFIKGNYTSAGNLHLTLKFIGEVSQDRIEGIKQCLNEVDFQKFKLKGNKIGLFERRNKAIIYFAIEENKELVLLYQEISKSLYRKGLIEKGQLNISYRPHVTLVRNIPLGREIKEYITSYKIKAEVLSLREITLFESVRIDDVLVYRSIYDKSL